MIENYITGASGFIGSHLASRIPAENHKTYDLTKGTPECERLFFLSTYGNMAHHDNHYEMIRSNVMDVIRMVSWNPQLFIFMSSSSVTLPVQTPYSRTKRAAEEILQALPELKSCIVRPYSVTGVGEQKEHLIPTLIRSCMEGEEMPFDPYPVHDFVDVSDVCEGLIRLADLQATGIHEFGSGKFWSNQEVRGLVEHATGRKANVKIVSSLREYDNQHWYCKNPSDIFPRTKFLGQSISEMVEAYKHEHA